MSYFLKQQHSEDNLAFEIIKKFEELNKGKLKVFFHWFLLFLGISWLQKFQARPML